MMTHLYETHLHRLAVNPARKNVFIALKIRLNVSYVKTVYMVTSANSHALVDASLAQIHHIALFV